MSTTQETTQHVHTAISLQCPRLELLVSGPKFGFLQFLQFAVRSQPVVLACPDTDFAQVLLPLLPVGNM